MIMAYIRGRFKMEQTEGTGDKKALLVAMQGYGWSRSGGYNIGFTRLARHSLTEAQGAEAQTIVEILQEQLRSAA